MTRVKMVVCFILVAASLCANSNTIEEIIVTAQKREQALQDIPIAVSVLNAEQLNTLGITSLSNLVDGVVPSLRLNPHGNNSSTLIATIRGDGPTDVAQVTREGNVPFYIDGIYLGRAQGLSLELIDPERIEILRGPQGTLFGRNSTGGAVSIVSKKPTGTFNVSQLIETGSFNEKRSITRVNLPELTGFKAKLDYVYSQKDGWVNNTAPGEHDYNESKKNGGQFSVSWNRYKNITIDYSYNDSTVTDTQPWFQVHVDNRNAIGEERNRKSDTRFPVVPLEPTTTNIKAHSFIADWAVSDQLTIKSLSSHRDLKEDGNNNYAGSLYFNGLIANEDIKTKQISQEFQFIGTQDNVEWVAGVYYFKENVSQDTQLEFSLLFDGTNFTPIPPNNFGLPASELDAKAETIAVYQQTAWSLTNRFELAMGVRYSIDKKSGDKTQFVEQSFSLDNDHLDPAVTAKYDFTDEILAYVKWSTAYKAGGVNIRSLSFLPYNKSVVKTWEAGIKSEFLNKKLTINSACFTNDYKDKQFDFIDPDNVTINETINAKKTVEIDGCEMEVSALPVSGLSIALSYTYLDGDLPAQENPRVPGDIQKFELTQTPKHSGSLMVDYIFGLWDIATVKAHFDVFSTDDYGHTSVPGTRRDAYTIANASIALSNLKLVSNNLSLKLYGNNIFDEEYVTVGFPAGPLPNSIVNAYGTPRTVGIQLHYNL